MHVTMDLTLEAWGIVGGAFVLIVFGITWALAYRPNVAPGKMRHRSLEDSNYEIILPDGYIDSFGGIIQETGGGVPPLMLVTLIGGVAWWLTYMMLYWQAGVR